MPSLANPVQNNPAALLHPGVLLACGLGFASLIAPPARADNQYCTDSSAVCIVKKPPFNSATDTYFWSPKTPPNAATVFRLQTIVPVGTVKRLTLRGSSNVTLNASGTANQEVLIGSLGSNILQGGAGGDTYVIGNTNATINNLPNCNTNGGSSDCVKSRNTSTFENDTVQLVNGSTEVIYIERCLQVTANGTPGLGGNKIGPATKANPNDVDYGPITDQNNTCPTTVAAVSNQNLRNLALGSHGDLQAPWQRWWPASTAWNRAISWLQQAITALIQGPHAVAQPWPTNRGPVNIDRVPSVPSDQREALSDLRRGVPCKPCYPGVARLIQSSEGQFLDASGDKIVVDGSTRTFNGQPLSSIGKTNPVHPQFNNKDKIPLNREIVFVYHQQLGILASYGNDKYPYGTEQNPGTVIAHLVLPNGRPLPANSIDSVTTENLQPRY
jgi:hypothetical protein